MKTNRALLKNLLPGLIPLFVFIAAEEIWGMKTGLIVAVAFGIAEFAFTYLKTKKIEKFILTDILLLSILGLISIVLENDVFFKLKPAFIELILAAIIGLSVFGPKNLVLSMSERYMKNIKLDNAMQKQMDKSLKTVFFITLGHIGLVVYSAYFMSDEAWAFIGGGLFYILFLGYFAFEFAKNKWIANKYKNVEWLPIVDQNGEVVGRKPRPLCHFKKDKPLHPVVHLHVFNSKGWLYLQKRPITKDIQPGKWDTAVGGHISVGETIETALERESEEEIGLRGFEAKLVAKYIWETEAEKEYVFVFVAKTNQTPSTHPTEVEEGRFWTAKEIEKNMGNGVFTPNLENEFGLLGKMGYL